MYDLLLNVACVERVTRFKFIIKCVVFYSFYSLSGDIEDIKTSDIGFFFFFVSKPIFYQISLEKMNVNNNVSRT